MDADIAATGKTDVAKRRKTDMKAVRIRFMSKRCMTIY